MTTPFVPFPKIPRLKRSICITEKIDGTNASVFVPEDGGPLLFGSRTRWITPEADNAGFARWAQDNAEALREQLGHGHHFGEWWGVGIQRRYGIPEKRFSLFNTGRWGGARRPAICHVVPLLYHGEWTQTAIDDAIEALRVGGSVAAPGFMRPEGVVVFHAASGGLYKVTIEGDAEPKGKSAEVTA